VKNENEKEPTEKKQRYVTPIVTVMSEDEILRSFQVTSAGGGWWLNQAGSSF